MPPKCKFTREEIVQAALEIARTEGMDAITARSLGAKLGSSPKPIFGFFANMEEVHRAVLAAAKKRYGMYVMGGLRQTDMPAFKGVGTAYIRFAIEEPKLFQLLFMTNPAQETKSAHILPVIDDQYEQILLSVREGYGLNVQDAQNLYRHLWVYSHGIAVLCATHMCTFTAEEISQMLTEVFAALLKEIKGGKPYAEHDRNSTPI